MKPSDVVLVKFPFSDLESSKKRPALVLSTSELTTKVRLVTIAMITSYVEGMRLPGDLQIQNWEQAHLLHPSLVRLSKIATVEFNLIDRTIGSLTPADMKAVQQQFQKQFKFWISVESP